MVPPSVPVLVSQAPVESLRVTVCGTPVLLLFKCAWEVVVIVVARACVCVPSSVFGVLIPYDVCQAVYHHLCVCVWGSPVCQCWRQVLGV